MNNEFNESSTLIDHTALWTAFSMNICEKSTGKSVKSDNSLLYLIMEEIVLTHFNQHYFIISERLSLQE